VTGSLSLLFRQRRIPLDRDYLRSTSQAALHHLPTIAPLPIDFPPAIHAVIVSDRVIAQIHRDFLNDPRPTDVITFQHGEIILSAETAHRIAQQRRFPTEKEILRYILHGLLHLAGYDDHTPTDRRTMLRLQETLLRTLLRQHPLPTG